MKEVVNREEGDVTQQRRQQSSHPATARNSVHRSAVSACSSVHSAAAASAGSLQSMLTASLAVRHDSTASSR
ncbi:hypothetical protein PIB30_060712, partial [Stylosanthes scabra]|nr:hypothetical protein [Stylosanthes scabra]